MRPGLVTILTPALALGQPVTKCSLAILVGGDKQRAFFLPQGGSRHSPKKGRKKSPSSPVFSPPKWGKEMSTWIPIRNQKKMTNCVAYRRGGGVVVVVLFEEGGILGEGKKMLMGPNYQEKKDKQRKRFFFLSRWPSLAQTHSEFP